MGAAQMFAHCAEIQEVTNGKALENTPFLVKLFSGIIRRIVFGDKPYPKGTRTHPPFKQSTEKKIDSEKERLLGVLRAFHFMDEETTANLRHPLFGATTREEKGWGTYKHLDHHLTQFGV